MHSKVSQAIIYPDGAVGNYRGKVLFDRSEVVNVKSFGAVGDGTTDCTSAFQYAADEARRYKRVLYIPPGDWLITSPLTVNGQARVIAGAGAELSNVLSNFDGDVFRCNETGTDSVTGDTNNSSYTVFRDFTIKMPTNNTGLTFTNSVGIRIYDNHDGWQFADGTTPKDGTGFGLRQMKFHNMSFYHLDYAVRISATSMNGPGTSFERGVPISALSFFGLRGVSTSGKTLQRLIFWDGGTGNQTCISHCQASAYLSCVEAGTRTSPDDERPQVGDMKIGNCHFNSLGGTAIKLTDGADSATYGLGYGKCISIVNNQFDSNGASVDLDYIANSKIIGNNWGGGTTRTLTNCTSLTMDSPGATNQDNGFRFGNDESVRIFSPNVGRMRLMSNTLTNIDTLSAGTVRIGYTVENPADAGAVLTVSPDAANVNGITVSGTATGTGPNITASGDDTDIDLSLLSKGVGQVRVGVAGGVALRALGTNGHVNAILVQSAATGFDPSIIANGTDTNIDLSFFSKGTGQVRLGVAGGIALRASGTSGDVNALLIQSASTGNVPTIIANGTDTNINLGINSKGTGQVRLGVTGGVGFRVEGTNGHVNSVLARSAAAAGNPLLLASGTDTNITLDLSAKGTGTVRFISNVSIQNGQTINMGNAILQTTQVNSSAAFGNVSTNGNSLRLTFTGVTTAAGALETMTVSNSWVTANSYVSVEISNYTGTYFTNGLPTLRVNNVTASAFDIILMNTHATNALSGDLSCRVLVMN
jgi:hypothetical protein